MLLHLRTRKLKQEHNFEIKINKKGGRRTNLRI